MTAVRASAIHALLAGAIDYAGLFPPASLPMSQAVANYAAYRSGENVWALGRFIVPVARLAEFGGELPAQGNSAWRVSALAGNNLAADLDSITAFNRQHTGRAVIDAIEIKANAPSAVAQGARLVNRSLELFVEMPLDAKVGDWLEAIVSAGVHAKIRTGGVTAEAFPSPAALAEFLHHSAAAHVRFKATAGLHHPIRAAYRLTYEPSSPSATMHGFVNVLMAAAFAHEGWTAMQLTEVLSEQATVAFRFDSKTAAWRNHELSVEQLDRARAEFLLSFGSCSFEEPMAELEKLGWL